MTKSQALMQGQVSHKVNGSRPGRWNYTPHANIAGLRRCYCYVAIHCHFSSADTGGMLVRPWADRRVLDLGDPTGPSEGLAILKRGLIED